jgi:hypothetical protein
MNMVMRARTITPTSIPGWNSTPYNLVTDTGGAPPNPTVDQIEMIYAAGGPDAGPGPDGFGFPVLWFTTTNANLGSGRPGGDDPVADAASIMAFNQIGVLAGPATNPNSGDPNVGGVITVNVVQMAPQADGTNYMSVVASATIDVTKAIPGNFYWSDPLAANFQIYGILWSGAVNQQIYYYLAMTSTVDYAMYATRPCLIRNGGQWGSSGESDMQPGLPPIIGTDRNYVFGVDLNLVNYRDLGTAPITPITKIAGQVLRRGELGAPHAKMVPQIQLTGQPQRAGVLHGGMQVESVTFNATSLSGGPLWKPAKLCTG